LGKQVDKPGETEGEAKQEGDRGYCSTNQ